MTPHWTERCEEIRAWLAALPQVFIGSDFDGTLAPLQPNANDVRLPDLTRVLLQRLAACPGVVLAFISGRGLADLRRRVDLPGVLYAGNHGLEMTAPDGTTVLAPAPASAGSAVRQVQAQLTAALAHLPGVWIEDKHITLSVHYRQADEVRHPEVELIVRDVVCSHPDLEVRPARRIWEVRPAIAWDKGSVLRRFLDESGIPSNAAAFMGDDVSDFDAFRELPDGWTFAVGTDHRSDARLHLTDPQDTADLLRWIVEQRAAS
ncbi:trehalose-phosphatase [Prosthecobacter sp.]|uniref:trehalose-phosphatase n=1 Tax=Prosthecobacter sp. TaxID=1965333 RepID=UPI001E018E89|nr:trehalose-phosphatase [Prosthecobacter sp.]MCB1276814.1 trehalose-phosphatase [Prosthecobacter sp.]